MGQQRQDRDLPAVPRRPGRSGTGVPPAAGGRCAAAESRASAHRSRRRRGVGPTRVRASTRQAEQRLEEKWGTGRLGRIAKALSDDPQTTKAWREGATGEEIVAQVLADRVGDRAVLLHDRKVPKTRGNIDHLAIASSGIWVIDAKKMKGRVERKDVGGMFRIDNRLFVAGRDRSKLVANLTWQVDAVRAVVDDGDVPIHPTLSFVDAEWAWFAKPIRIDGVLVAWPRKLADLIDEPGPLDEEQVVTVATRLSHHLPAN